MRHVLVDYSGTTFQGFDAYNLAAIPFTRPGLLGGARVAVFFGDNAAEWARFRIMGFERAIDAFQTEAEASEFLRSDRPLAREAGDHRPHRPSTEPRA